MKSAQRAAAVAALLVLTTLGSALATGCGSSEAAPLQVTYYYLPG